MSLALELDDRQRAMLEEMGVHVWEPMAEPEARMAPAAVPMPTPVAPNAEVVPRHAAVPPRAVSSPESTGLALLGWSDLESLAPAGIMGEGNRNADWMFVIEASGQNDPQGDPFTGQGAKLLDGMLRAIGLARPAVYVVCAIRGESPASESSDALLRRQVELVKPKIIVAMGRFAAQALCQTTNSELAQLPLGKMRGLAHPYRINTTDSALVVTYAPSSLLRIPADKAKAWADLCLALVTLESR